MSTEAYRAVVTRVDSAGGVWVQVPALGSDLEFGPCDVATDAALMSAGERVLVGTVTGTLDDIVIFGALDADTANMQWFYAAGAGAPAVGVGNNNDWAINDVGQTYEKVAGVWVAKANIRGATGPTGPTGASGTAIYYGDVNLFSNPLFETVGGATNHDDQVSGWTAFWRGLGTWLSANQSSFETDVSAWATGTNAPTLASSTAQAHAGTKSALVTWGTFGAGSSITTTVAGLVVGKQYTLTGWVYVATGPGVQLSAAGTNSPTSTTFGAWQKLTVTFTATATTQTLAMVSAGPTTAGQQVYLDDLVLVPVRDSEVVTVADPVNVYSGTRSLRVTLPGESLAGASNSLDQNTVFPVTAGEIITARIKLKTTSGAPTFVSRLVCAPPGGSPDFFGSGAQWQSGPTWTPTSTWTEYVTTFVVPSGCTQARLIPIIGKNDAPSATDSIMWADEGAIYREAAANVGNSSAPLVRNFLNLAPLLLYGGGIRDCQWNPGVSPRGISWTGAFNIANAGRGSQLVTDGIVAITMPADGTVITGYGGASNVTVTGGKIPLNDATTLFYDVPLAAAGTFSAARFKIVGHSADFDVPATWVPICTLDGAHIERFIWGDGRSESGWHYVGAVNEIAFQNGWSNYGSTWETVGYCRVNGIVYLQGLAKGGTATSGAVIFNLPAGYRPQGDKHITIPSAAAFGLINVMANGDVKCNTPISATWASFANITHRAAA